MIPAQSTSDATGTQPAFGRATALPSSTETGSGEVSNGLALSISSIENSTVYPGSESQQWRELTSFSSDDPHIDVVLQNVSAQPISVHQEWNSWGYSNLSLEILKIDGKPLPKPVTVQRVGGSWFRNFPESQTIAPGESIVREVHFPPATGKKLKSFLAGDGYYSPFPFKLGTTQPVIYTMRAVFQDARSDAQQYAPPSRTGKATSPTRDYIFR